MLKSFKKTLSRLSCIGLVSLLAACSSAPPEPKFAPVALPSFAAPVEESADFYLAQAKMSETQTFDWELLAARAYYQQGVYQAGDAVIGNLEAEATTLQQQAGVSLTKAYGLQQQGKIQPALKLLDFDPLWQLPEGYWQQYYQTRAELFAMLNQPLAVVNERISLDAFLEQTALEANRQAIWQELKPLSAFTLRSFQQPGQEIKNGWLEIVAISNDDQLTPQSLVIKLQQWEQAYPEHPAATLISGDMAKALEVSPYLPQKIAVLLPLSGRYQGTGQAIRDGLLTSLSEKSKQEQQPELVFYNTDQQDVSELYNELLLDEIDFVIGPLLKSNLRLFLALQPEIPMLALNQVETLADANRYYFPLSPENEARQAANYLTEQGELSPLVIAPQSSLGQRMAQAFDEEWQVLHQREASVIYFANNSDLQRAVRALFQTDQSQQRVSQLQKVLGIELESEVRSRRDAHALYVIGDSSEIKLIKPFVDVTVSPFAATPRIYASSRGYEKGGDAVELNETVFSEMPWMLDNQSILAIQYQQLWPKASDNQKRMYALGYDAYGLVSQLAQLRAYDDYQLPALTGTLSISELGEVKRQLVWSRYQDGELVPLEEEQTPAQ